MPRVPWVVVTVCLGGAAWASAVQEPSADPPAAVAEQPPPAIPPSEAAGSADQPAPTAVVDSASTSQARTEITLDKATHVTAGIGFSGPLGAAASLRILHGRSPGRPAQANRDDDPRNSWHTPPRVGP